MYLVVITQPMQINLDIISHSIADIIPILETPKTDLSSSNGVNLSIMRMISQNTNK